MSKKSEEIIAQYNSYPEEKKLQVTQFLDELTSTTIQTNTHSPLIETEILLPGLDRAARFSLARAIADQIAKTKIIRTYSINGEWGCGKTVFMDWLKEELEAKKDEKIIVVPFNAWKHERIGNMVYPLMQELKERAEGKVFKNKMDEYEKKVFVSVAVLFGIGIIAHPLGLKEAITIIVQLSKSIMSRLKDLDKRNEEVSALQSDFQNWVDYIIQSYEKPKCSKIVFLIDELDRCSPENVLTMLESIKIFLGAKNTVFVFSIDKGIIAKAISSKYGSLSIEDGHEYLEKMIEFSYELPFKSEIVWNNLYSDIKEDFSSLNSVDMNFVPTLLTLSGISSLRKVKRILNRFVFVLEEFERNDIKMDERIVFFVLFLQDVYPQVYDFTKRSRPQNVFEQIKGINIDRIRNKNESIGIIRKVIELVETTNIQKIDGEFRKLFKNGPQDFILGEQIIESINQMERIGV
ncbi:MAG: P-loop NTPase fold protein [Bacteroidota bacterium]